MSYIRNILLIIILLFSVQLFAQKIKINLFHGFNIKTLVIRPVVGRFEYIADDNKPNKIRKSNIIYLTIIGDSVGLWDLDKHIGIFKNIKIIGISKENNFRIEPAYPALKERRYKGNIEIYVKKGGLFIINEVDIENYIAGVVESEGGPKAPPEYYKSQAIICRTYALDHFNRHIDEGFNLCDGVHCQVYKSMSYQNDTIIEATKITKGLVITDTTNSLITAAFHSNSGGQTVNSEDVWSSETSYLKSIIDTFSLNQRNSTWQDTISITDWITYLDTIGIEINQQTFSAKALSFEQDKRKVYYNIINDTILLKKIRKDFNLRSTYFSMKLTGNELILTGKGYGHGVGLCQEGAMQMARMGYNFMDIIYFYYKDVNITNLQELHLFNIYY